MFVHPLQRQDHTEVTGPHLTLVLPVSAVGQELNVQCDLLISTGVESIWYQPIVHQFISLYSLISLSAVVLPLSRSLSDK